MLKSSLWDTKEENGAVLRNSKHQDDVKLHGEFPRYGDSRRYDLWQEGILRQIARGGWGGALCQFPQEAMGAAETSSVFGKNKKTAGN